MVDEQKAETQNKSTDKPEDTNAGNPKKVLDKVERAELAVKRLEETEKRIDDKIARLAELQADRILGGTAGGRVETQVKEETAEEYAKRVMSGKL